jgi:hypothetical protein
MMAYEYANIEKDLHGIAFKGGSHMPCGENMPVNLPPAITAPMIAGS